MSREARTAQLHPHEKTRVEPDKEAVMERTLEIVSIDGDRVTVRVGETHVVLSVGDTVSLPSEVISDV